MLVIDDCEEYVPTNVLSESSYTAGSSLGLHVPGEPRWTRVSTWTFCLVLITLLPLTLVC